MKLKRQFRFFDLSDAKVDAEARTVEFPFSSERAVERYFGKEILSHERSAIDLERASLGAVPLLFNHDPNQLIGDVKSIQLGADKRCVAKVYFSEDPEADRRFKQVQEGVLKNVSFGYQIKEMELASKSGEEAEYIVRDWEIFELSFVSIPADPTVGMGRSDEGQEFEVRILNNTVEEKPTKGENKNMDIEINKAREEAIKADRERASAIRAMGKRHNMTELAEQLAESGKSVDEAREAIMEKLEKRQTPVDTNAAVIGLNEREIKKFSILRAINAMANPHDAAAQKAAAYEREVSAAAEKAAGKSARGIMIPVDILRASQRDLLVGTPTAGGNLVATDLKSGSFIELLRNKMALQRLGATVLNGLTGNIAIPKQTGAATAYWVGENSAPTEGQQTIGQVAMSPKTVGAYTDFSRKLMLQSSIDVENMVKADLASVLGLAIDLAGLYGSGSANQPAGLFVTSGINTKDFANSDPTWAEIVGMESEVAADNADVGSLAYLTNARGRGVLKTTDKASGAAQFIMDQSGLVNGYRCEVSNQVKTLSSTDHDYWFGNWADLILGFWSGLDLLVDPYTGSKEGTVRVVAFQDVDVAVRQPESFCYGNKTI